MREPSAEALRGPAREWADGPPQERAVPEFRAEFLLVLLLAASTVAWQCWAVPGGAGGWSTGPAAAVDFLLALPAAGAAVRLSGAALRRLPVRRGVPGELLRGSVLALAFTAVMVPVSVVQAAARSVLGSSGDLSGVPELYSTDPVGLLRYGVSQATQLELALLVALVVGLAAGRVFSRAAARPTPEHVPAAAAVHGPPLSGRSRRRAFGPRTAVVGLVVAGLLLPNEALAGANDLHRSYGDCATAPQRVFDISAIDIDLVVDRFGDHDPYGYMYVLNSRLQAVRDQEAALERASSLPKDDPTAAKVSIGLGEDPMQPLVMRARLGECVVINLTNKITQPVRGGELGNPPIVQPGGLPSVSVDMAGVAYDAARGDGGQAVGDNPTSVMAAPGETKQYRYYLDPAMGEGGKVFRSGGDSQQLTYHGLFGSLIAETAGSRWFDPMSGAEKTWDNGWSNWEAMIQPRTSPTFREFTLMYHEIGDEDFNLRRPLRENTTGIPIGGDPGVPVGDQVQYGRPLPMIDVRPPTASTPEEGGGGTDTYRPGAWAINYRSEPFYRRLQLEAPRGQDAQKANESLGYSSYTYGDPATPMPRSYLGEATKTRLMNTGVGQLHVHHLHGGGTRWAQNPGVDQSASTVGLRKTPDPGMQSIDLDSQTVSPGESYTLDHECGAGGCQQAPGDYLFHCHISQHYIAGMWGIWRVFDTRQPDLAPLPGNAQAPAAVDSAGLLGKVIQGKTVVLQADLTDQKTQVALEKLVEGYLPPQGTRWTTATGSDPDDATVWDWQKGGSAQKPVYLGEPETSSVWANYRSAAPGSRPTIMFNPDTGKPAYPLLKPHLGMRPPFAPGGHSGAPYLGETATAQNPGAICPSQAPVRQYNTTAVTLPIKETARETDTNGELYVLNEDKAGVLAGTKPADPLTIRANVGDCVGVIFGSELNPTVQAKVNMHTHFVQFDPLASDGVITGFAFEQSVFSDTREGRTLSSSDAPDKVTVNTVGELRPGVSIGIGVGRTDVEIRTITAINGNQLTFDKALTNSHAQGEPVTTEFVQYRWFADVDSGTVFWHDHVNGVTSWAHGLFGALIIEPKGSTYRDPVTGAPVRSGTNVDIINNDGSVGTGESGSFREFMLFLHNGRRGRSELSGTQPGTDLIPFNNGQECEEGSINLRAAPLGERTPPGQTPTDPKTTDQRQEFNGERCRNAFVNDQDVPGSPDVSTAKATVTTVDPYVFSSVKYGDPMTPLLRAYAGDPVVIRTIGLSDRAEALRIQGHRFRLERFSPGSQLSDTATVGMSERYDYVLDGGAGGPSHSPGDYLYYSTRTFALESGAWGIFRVYGSPQSDLLPLPAHPAPTDPQGFPRQSAATGNTQRNPGPAPASAYRADGSVNTDVVTSTANPCPSGARPIHYDVSLFDQPLPTEPYSDTGGVVYALTSDVAAMKAGTKPVEPLVLRVDQGDCVSLTLHNQVSPGSLYGGVRAGLDLAKLTHNQQLSAGSAIGLNPDSTVGAGGTVGYTYYADQALGTSLFQNLGSVASLRHGAYGMMIVEPRGATWSDSETGAPLGTTATSTEAIIRAPGQPRFREFALTMQTTDQQFGRGILPYDEEVAGNGVNSPFSFNVAPAPVPGAPPGTSGNPGSYDKGYSDFNYHSAPLTTRLGLTANINDFTKATVIGSYGTAFSSTPYGDPHTPVFRANSGDPVVFRVGVGASDQLHSFTVSGHTFPMDPLLQGSQLMTARTVTAGETIDARIGKAGADHGYTGDYLFSDARMGFVEAGMWGILRVLPDGSPDSPAHL
ncbi:cupredoxin domain-containing protein [Kitasatospora mediocidica]|uniref:multicopper oxidase domain-containing protein n=1 Tax=Kitasatospora mediocidica TaxID=58352 RepID=UPI0005617443|nr:multicopper oxidase domain-containing protein [Kitasatospora mediocidica]